MKIDFEGVGSEDDCCANLIFTIDTVNTKDCGFDFVNIYDNSDTSSISFPIFSHKLEKWQDSLFTVPMTFCNYDTVAKKFLVEILNKDSMVICSKLTNQFLPPCNLNGILSNENKNKESFDITTKSIKKKEITFEYFIKQDETIEIELFNKYNISLGVIQKSASKKGSNEFTLNTSKFKPDIYVVKMNGNSDKVIRRLVIE